nr:hypothetical protein [Prevotella sp.]
MEAKINIVEILKDKPQGVKLYSRICGEVELKEVLDVRKKKSIVVKELNSSNQHRFWYDGKFFRAGQCVLQPSKEMADWSKFSWKKGDVLVCKDVNSHIIFEKFNDDTYATFTGKLYYQATRAGYSYTHTRNLAMTQDFDIEKGDAAQTYIKTIEEKLGGKLNLDTLEIEKIQAEFKDGDIAFADFGKTQDVFIVSGKTNLSEGYYSFIALNLNSTKALSIGCKTSFFKENLNTLRLATEEEKQQLFDALAEEGKAWDAEKKQIVDLKPKVELKPFDRVLCRDGVGKEWHIDLFESVLTDNSEYNYKCMVNVWKICIKYKGNEYLLGTANNVEG